MSKLNERYAICKCGVSEMLEFLDDVLYTQRLDINIYGEEVPFSGRFYQLKNGKVYHDCGAGKVMLLQKR